MITRIIMAAVIEYDSFVIALYPRSAGRLA